MKGGNIYSNILGSQHFWEVKIYMKSILPGSQLSWGVNFHVVNFHRMSNFPDVVFLRNSI